MVPLQLYIGGYCMTCRSTIDKISKMVRLIRVRWRNFAEYPVGFCCQPRDALMSFLSCLLPPTASPLSQRPSIVDSQLGIACSPGFAIPTRVRLVQTTTIGPETMTSNMILFENYLYNVHSGYMSFGFRIRFCGLALIQRKTPWVDSACADCPGFSGPGCCSCPGFHLRLGASDCCSGLAFCFMGPWTFAWICCLQLPCHPCKTGRTAHVFTAQGGTRRLMVSVLLRNHM